MNDKDLIIAKDFYQCVCKHMKCSKPMILEIGCGYGVASTYMWQIADCLTLTDTDAKAIDYISSPTNGKDNILAKCMSSDQIEGKFDVVYYFLSLHHISDIKAELKEAKRLLAEDGQLIICDYRPDPHYLMHQHDSVPHEGFEINELMEKISCNGFHIQAISELTPLERIIHNELAKFSVYVIIANRYSH